MQNVAAAEAGQDHGLFGPGSVTWRIMGEPVLMIGGCTGCRACRRPIWPRR